LAKVIGQRWEIYNYEAHKTIIPKRGEMVVVSGTPDYGSNVIQLIADGTKNIQELYTALKAGDVSIFQATINAEAQARQQEVASLRDGLAQIVNLIEANYGAIPVTLLNTAEDGFYLMTAEDGDYIAI
jgi:hypothetical protein